MSLVLPIASFADIAFELRNLAWREAAGAEQILLFAAQHPDLIAFVETAETARLSAERIGEACRLFETLTPFETKARRLLSTIDAGIPARRTSP